MGSLAEAGGDLVDAALRAGLAEVAGLHVVLERVAVAQHVVVGVAELEVAGLRARGGLDGELDLFEVDGEDVA